MIHSGPPVFHFRSGAVYTAASTFTPLAHILKATVIFFVVIKSSTVELLSRAQVEPQILSLKYYQLRILASNRKWDTGLVVMVARIV